jgi:predicted AAA+ superfamily ATPase
MDRKVFEELKRWKKRVSRKPLLIQGARQVGKTWLMREFGRREYANTAYLSFADHPEAAAIFEPGYSVQGILQGISLMTGETVEAGSTLIILDEIQECERALNSLKFMRENAPQYHIMAAGSLLGVAVRARKMSFPVGQVDMLTLHPLSFIEFLRAMGEKTMVQIIEDGNEGLMKLAHEKLTVRLKEYMYVGGMPEAVQSFLDNRRALGAAREVDLAVVEQYRYDISRYVSTSRRPVVQTIFDNIPSQLAKENKRFMLRSIKAGATYERLDDDFAWLTKAGVALPAHLVREPRYPLERTRVAEKFKLYSSDCGVLLSQYPTGAAVRVASGTGDANFGAVYENVVAQELLSAGFPLRYYHHSKKGEVDFLIETSEGAVLPIEVKSGKNYKLHTALNNLLGTKEYGIDCAYVLSEHNVSRAERMGKPVYYLPLYMVMCLSAERGESELHKTTLEAVGFEDLL